MTTMLANSFNVFGVPRIFREDTFRAFEAICNALDCTVNETDLKELYIVSHKDNMTAHISGTFHDLRKKTEIMNAQKIARRFKKPIMCEDIFTTIGPTHPLRGREITFRSLLLDRTRELYNFALEYWDIYKYIWEVDGKVLVRVSDTSRPVEILSQNHLIQLAGPPNYPGTRRPRN